MSRIADFRETVGLSFVAFTTPVDGVNARFSMVSIVSVEELYDTHQLRQR